MPKLWPGRQGPAINYISPTPGTDFCKKFPRTLAILGSTGSIGRAALSVIDSNPGCFHIMALAGGRNVELLAQQAQKYKPALLGVLNTEYAKKLRRLLPDDYKPQIVEGAEGYARIASEAALDCILSAQVGASALAATIAATLAGKVIALANKESLVIAGDLLRHICHCTGASILPVDSEHHAIFQCVAGRGQSVARLILTASGGPFFGKDKAQLENMQAQDALKHPNWQMGSKITIDSATMMNKGLEIIEAMRLYGIDAEGVEVLVHPQSIVHSLVQFKDNSLLAQLAQPNMRLPIANCLLWPRCEESFIEPLNLASIGTLTFYEPDNTNFPCLDLAKRAASFTPEKKWLDGGMNPACIVLNAANEAAVELFLAGKCGFCDIPVLIGEAIEQLVFRDKPKIAPVVAESDTTSAMAVALACRIEQLDRNAREYVTNKAMGCA